MKQISKFVIVLLLSLIFNSCSDNADFSETSNLSQLKSDLIQKGIRFETRKEITALSKALGSESMLANNNKNKSSISSFKMVTSKGFYFKDNYIDLSNYEYLVEDGFISTSKINKYALGTFESDLLLKDENGIRKLEKNSIFKETKEFLILFSGLNELVSKEERSAIKTKSNQLAKGVGCSIWDTYVTIETGASRSVAEENGKYRAKLDNRLVELSGSSCRQTGTTDTSCAFGDHLCFSTNTYCCPDNDPPY